MNFTSGHFRIAVVTIILFGLGCASEEDRWKDAESVKTVSAYQEYLRSYPQGKSASEARSNLSKLTNGASVVIDFPDTLESESSYHNIGGPVWVFTVKFLEVGGIGAHITGKKMQIFTGDGTAWGDRDFEEIFDSEAQQTVTIKLGPYDTGSHTSWVNSPDPPCQLCGARLVLDYIGQDANGKSVNVGTSFIIKK